MKKNEKGFSVIEVLVVLVVIGLIGLGGWYVWSQNNKKTDTNTQNTGQSSQSNAQTNLSTYDDEFINFSYPADWKVERQYTFTDTYGAYTLNITAPVDKSLKGFYPDDTEVQLVGNINIASNDRFGAEREGGSCAAAATCTVIHVDKVSPKSPQTQGSLVVNKVPELDNTQTVGYSPNSVAVGATSYSSRIKLNDSYYAGIGANYETPDNKSFVKLTSETDLQNSTAYKQFKELISTITFKTNKLP